MPFPIGGPLEWSLYLKPFSRYWALTFQVTWHHRWWPCDSRRPFPIGGSLKPSLHIYRFQDIQRWM